MSDKTLPGNRQEVSGLVEPGETMLFTDSEYERE